MLKQYKYIDLTYLEDISSGDTKTKINLINVFFEQIDRIKAEFDKALNNHNCDELQKTVHLAKSTLKVMGINHLSDKMLEFEQLLKNNTENINWQDYIQLFNKDIDLAIEELKSELLNIK